jgi:hypothetical protein
MLQFQAHDIQLTVGLSRKPSEPSWKTGTVETYLPVTMDEWDEFKDGDLCCCISTASLWIKW